MGILQYASYLITGLEIMSVVFENIVTNNTKEFVFTVRDNADGTYSITASSYRIYANGDKKETYRKEWVARGLQELRKGEYTRTRQGKLFLDSQFWTKSPG